MTRERYIRMFESLDMYECDESGVHHQIARPNTGRVMRHPDVDLPRFYFNRNRNGLVYFAAKLYDQEYFPEDHWDRMPYNLVKDSDGIRLNIVPIAGRERRAFASLIESANGR